MFFFFSWKLNLLPQQVLLVHKQGNIWENKVGLFKTYTQCTAVCCSMFGLVSGKKNGKNKPVGSSLIQMKAKLVLLHTQ